MFLNIFFLEADTGAWILGNDNGLWCFVGSVGKSLVQLLSNIWHSWVKEQESCIQANVKRVEGSFLGLGVVALHDWLQCFDVVVSEFFQPEVIEALNHSSEVVLLHPFGGLGDHLLKASKNPFV